MKIKAFVFFYLLSVIFYLPADPIPPDVANAFTEAGLPVLKDSVSPIDFTLPLLDGQNQELKALRGKVVFLNFWATWCGPCRSEMPSMEKVHKQLKGKGFEMLAVNSRESPSTVQSFLKEANYTFPIALDQSGQTSARYGIRAIPTTYIIDKNGKIVSRLAGAIDWSDPKIVAALETLL